MLYNLFDDFFNDDFFNGNLINRSIGTAVPGNMRTDVRENEKDYLLSIELPGYNKEDINAELKDGYLTISAKREASNEDKDNEGRYVRRERVYGSCSRSFYVGKELTEEDIRAAYKDGVLHLSIPKDKEKLPETKKLIAIE